MAFYVPGGLEPAIPKGALSRSGWSCSRERPGGEGANRAPGYNAPPPSPPRR